MTRTRRRPALGTPTAEQNAAAADEFEPKDTPDLWHVPDVVADLHAALALGRFLAREVAR